MTKEEIIKKYEMVVEGGKQIAPLMGEDAKKIYEMLKAGLSALRPITREQVEKVWRGEWQVCFEEWQNHRVEGEQCSKCGFQNYGPSNLYNFCPKCGSPMTDKAVDMVMERLEALKDEKG